MITVIEATDGDFGENSALTYSIAETGSSEGAQQFFEIKDQKVILKGSLDREVQSEYTVSLRFISVSSSSLFLIDSFLLFVIDIGFRLLLSFNDHYYEN